ncbi:hypothetical protein ECG_02020 [Echinococcus granulosus]|nr:hypothetical protein ECG_02020 [Echinococcus granulosus]
MWRPGRAKAHSQVGSSYSLPQNIQWCVAFSFNLNISTLRVGLHLMSLSCLAVACALPHTSTPEILFSNEFPHMASSENIHNCKCVSTSPHCLRTYQMHMLKSQLHFHITSLYSVQVPKPNRWTRATEITIRDYE